MTLIERLEAASGPDMELDEAIWLATKCHIEPQRSYTASIDAALTLVPKGRHATISTKHPVAAAVINGDPWCYATPALALCIAALRAREVSSHD